MNNNSKILSRFITKYHITGRLVADALDIHLVTAYNKINGRYPVTYDEILRIKKTYHTFLKNKLEKIEKEII